MRNNIDGLIGFKYNENLYYYSKNLQNDIIGILDSNYNLIVNYKYDRRGNIISITDSNGTPIMDSNHIGIINPFRYRGYYYDVETNLYYLNSRYYSPILKRFLNADGIIGTAQNIMMYNLYMYCGNNPITNFDCTGMFYNKFRNLANNVRKLLNNLDEVRLYATTIYAESAGQNLKTKKAVAHSINNHVGYGEWKSKKSITDVITQERQYDGYGKGENRLYKSAISYYKGERDEKNERVQNALDESMTAAITVYLGLEEDFTGGVVFFHSFDNASDWRCHEYYELVNIEGTTAFWWYKLED